MLFRSTLEEKKLKMDQRRLSKEPSVAELAALRLTSGASMAKTQNMVLQCPNMARNINHPTPYLPSTDH